MYTINAQNVNDALQQGVALLAKEGQRENSRNGPVLRLPLPLGVLYQHPEERVLFLPHRDANPFFHIVEAAWMLAGREDCAALTPYVRRMAEFSDDGGLTQPAAYGRRWRGCFHLDQLDWVVKRLRADPSDRRCVIQMWDAEVDLPAADRGGKDVPCNLVAVPQMHDGQLNLTVFNRSNDAVWGAFGANAVHFSMLLEYLACRLGVPVGWYCQTTTNLHAYLSTMMEPWDPAPCPYRTTQVKAYPLFHDFMPGLTDEHREKVTQEDLRIFFEHGAVEAQRKARWPWVRQVLAPMAIAHQHWRTKRGEDRYLGALEILRQVQAKDWGLAANQWVERRQARWERAQDDGVKHDESV